MTGVSGKMKMCAGVSGPAHHYLNAFPTYSCLDTKSSEKTYKRIIVLSFVLADGALQQEESWRLKVYPYTEVLHMGTFLTEALDES